MLFGSAGARSTSAGVACARDSTEALVNSNEARIMTAPRLGPVAHVAHAAHVGSLKPQTRQIFDQTKPPKAKGYKGRALVESCCGKPIPKAVFFF